SFKISSFILPRKFYFRSPLLSGGITLEPGVNVSALARRLGVSPAQLFGWRKAFLKKQTHDIAPATPVLMVEIVVGGVIIRVSPDLDEAALRRILRAVRAT
ncbi:transposase, partial [Yoonia sp. 67]|uniref:transposase n=1 Tax=Yoonia sp. 67 TaxID=3081449 RepID=UPI002AFFAEFD